MRAISLLTKFIRLSWVEHLLLLEATLWLGMARIAILTVPFRLLARYWGRQMVESPAVEAREPKELLKQVSRAVAVMSHYLPWETKCLAQALAAKMMLKCRGISSTLYLGLTKDQDNEIKAHAWLRSGTVVLTGSRGKNKFTVVSTFT